MGTFSSFFFLFALPVPGGLSAVFWSALYLHGFRGGTLNKSILVSIDPRYCRLPVRSGEDCCRKRDVAGGSPLIKVLAVCFLNRKAVASIIVMRPRRENGGPSLLQRVLVDLMLT